MTSSTPPRRPSPAVYRRRRLVLLLAVLVVVALVWLLIAQPWRGSADEPKSATAPRVPDGTVVTALPGPADPSPSTAVTPSSSPSSPAPSSSAPSPSVSSTASGPKACTPADLKVEAITDQDTYRAGQDPKLSIRLTNTGAKDCTLDVGTATQAFTISSGSDVWWRSTDCQSQPSSQVALLAAGQTVSSATPIVWDRTRSSVKTCDSTSRPKAPAGGASYHLKVEIGGVASDQTRQFLLY